MPIRLLLLIPTLDRNGAEKQLTLLATGLPRDEFDVHVCCLTRGGPLADTLRDANIPVTVIGKRWKVDPLAFVRLRKQIRALRPDIIHTWLFAANSYGRAAALLEHVPCIVAGERCVDPWKRWHELAVDRWLAWRTQRIITNSTGVREFYASKGLDPNLFEVIPNGIQVASMSASSPEQAPGSSSPSLAAELGLPANSRIIGTIGRLWPQKRHRDMIWAADLLKCLHDDVHLAIIGDGPLRWRLERYAWQLEITDRVHFLGERNDVSTLLPQFTCFWLGSGYEGQSNALMEAMAAGLPVVATDIPGNRDLVVPGETGYLVPVGDRAEIARKTERLLENPDLARQLGAAGRRRMETEFTIGRMVQRHADVYRRLAQSRLV